MKLVDINNEIRPIKKTDALKVRNKIWNNFKELDFEQLTLLNSSFVLQETQDTHKNEIERAGGKK
jgi:hypothetical protein